MDGENILEGQTRSRQLTERAAAAAAQDGRLFRNTLAASESNSHTQRDDERRNPNPETDPVPAGHNGQNRDEEAELAVQRLTDWGRQNLPDRRPSQVRPGPLRMNYAADGTPMPAGDHGRAFLRARERRRSSFDSDGGFDPSYRPGASYISLDDAKELLSHSLQQFSLNAPKVGSVDITRGIIPKWEGKEKFNHYEYKVGLFMKRHKVHHLLSKECTSDEQHLHDQALLVVMDQLPNGDQMAVRSMTHLYQVWEFLKQKYHPSIEADRARLMRQWDKCVKGNRTVKEFHSEIISLHEQLSALEYNMPRFLVLDKLLDCGKEFELVRASVEYSLKQEPDMSYFKIMGEFVAYEQRMGLQSNKPNPGAHKRQQGQHAGGRQQGDVLAVQGDKETRACYNCKEIGHLEADCPKLSEDTKKYLRKRQKEAQEANKKRRSGRRRGGQ